MYEAMKRNPYATNRDGVIKPQGKPDTNDQKATVTKGNDLRNGK